MIAKDLREHLAGKLSDDTQIEIESELFDLVWDIKSQYWERFRLTSEETLQLLKNAIREVENV
jgi:hypothetical protein